MMKSGNKKYIDVNVIDSPMGWGKTSWAIQYMNSHPENNYLFITPFLTETERIEESCPDLDFVRPNRNKGKGRKSSHLKTLLLEKQNISSTHSLFMNIDDEVLDLLRISNYTLIIDEAFEAITIYNMFSNDDAIKVGEKAASNLARADLRTLMNKGFVDFDEKTRAVHWIDSDNMLWKYGRLINLAKRGLLFATSELSLVWTFPPEFFQVGIFKDVYIMTYQSKYQLQNYYFGHFGIPTKTWYVSNVNDTKEKFGKKYSLKPYGDGSHEMDWKNKIASKINIVDVEKMNRVGAYSKDDAGHAYYGALSKRWYSRNPDKLKKIRNNTINFFRYHSCTGAKESLWACFKSDRDKVSSRNLTTRNWVTINEKSTNEYADRTALAYLVNRYSKPEYSHFFSDGEAGETFDRDGYALAEMLQLIFRTAIRNEKEIWLYIPSERMRNLLKMWMDGKK